MTTSRNIERPRLSDITRARAVNQQLGRVPEDELLGGRKLDFDSLDPTEQAVFEALWPTRRATFWKKIGVDDGVPNGFDRKMVEARRVVRALREKGLLK